MPKHTPPSNKAPSQPKPQGPDAGNAKENAPSLGNDLLDRAVFHIKNDWPVLWNQARLGALCLVLVPSGLMLFVCWVLLWQYFIPRKDSEIKAKTGIIELQEAQLKEADKKIQAAQFESGRISSIQNLASNLFPDVATSAQLGNMYALLASITNSLQLIVPSKVRAAIASDDQYPVVPHGFQPSSFTKPIATIGELREPVITGKTVVLSGIPPTEIEQELDGHKMRILGHMNKEFIGCDIYGPAVVGLWGTNWKFSYNDLEGFEKPESIILDMRGRAAFGIIPMINCSFIKCRFNAVSFTGPAPLMEILLRGIDAKE